MTAVVIGQMLYEPRGRSNSFREHTVLSIGRKWIALDAGARCGIDSLMLDCGGYAPRQLYASIDECLSERSSSAAWGDLCRDLQRHKRPDSMNVDQINEIRAQLGLQVFAKVAP